MEISKRTKNIQSIPALKEAADRWFSRRRRLEECDNNGIARCCTCYRFFHIRNMDNGHCEQRNYMNLRYDVKNTNPQCTSCNSYNNGEKDRHARYIDRKHGAGTAEYLSGIRKKQYKRSRYDYWIIIEENKQIVKRLLQEKGIEKWW